MNTIKFLRRFALTSALALAPLAGHASVIGDLNSLFLSNATPGGAINTSDRMGYTFGGISARAPIKNINLIAFDPPRVSAGCGNIDLYLGSFSFINGDQIVAVLRAVAANAAGLAFQAAISAISPSLSDLMKHFQALMQSLNNMTKNSCQLAHAIVDPFTSQIHDAVEGSGTDIANAFGISSDTISNLDNYITQGTTYLNKLGQKNPNVGNGTVKALIASGATGSLSVVGYPGLDDDATQPNSMNNRLMVSILGYMVAGVGCANQNNAGTQDSTAQGAPATSNASKVTPVDCGGNATIDLSDIYNGGGTGSTRPDNKLTIYYCVNPDGSGDSDAVDQQPCTTMQRKEEDFAGVYGWTLTQLKGDADETTDPVAGSILAQVVAGTTINLSDAQRAFMRGAGVPLGLLSREANPQKRRQVGLELARYVATCYTARLGVALYKAGQQTTRDDKYRKIIPTATADNLSKLGHDVHVMEKRCEEDLVSTNLMQQLDLRARVATGTH